MHVILYLDQGSSLSQFQKIGTLDREMAFYRDLIMLGYRVTILTWSKGEDQKLLPTVYPIEIVENKTRLPNRIWMILALFTLLLQSKDKTIVVSNQLFGGYIAAGVTKILRKPFILRFGFLNSLQDEVNYGRGSVKYLKSAVNEFFSGHCARHIVVTTDSMKQEFCTRRKLNRDKISVLPNYVNMEMMKNTLGPLEEQAFKGCFNIVMTARLAFPKRHDLLIKALQGMENCRLHLIGDGPDREMLEELAITLNVDVHFWGRQEHVKLARFYAQSDVFVLFSEYEGHPKSLIEAMAVGLPVIGSDVVGVRDVIKNEENGILVDKNEKALREVLEKMQLDEAYRRKYSKGASLAAKKFNLKHYVRSFTEIFETV